MIDYDDDEFADFLDDENGSRGQVVQVVDVAGGSNDQHSNNAGEIEVIGLDEVQSDFEDPADEDAEEEAEDLTPEARAEVERLAAEMAHIPDDELLQLIALNQSYLEIIEGLISKTDRALSENREAQEALHERMSSSKRPDKLEKGITWSLYVKPYFKDDFGMTPRANAEAERLIRTHELTTLLREERYWSETDLNKLRNGVKRILLKQMNSGPTNRIALLQDKIKNFGALNTEEELEEWKKEIRRLDYQIKENQALPDEEIFKGDYSNVSWQEISVVDFELQRSATQCRMRWCNEQCPQINKTPWTMEEDEKILEAAKERWTNWGFLADELGTNRSEYQVAVRAKELEVKYGDDKIPWTAADDEKLLSIVYSMHNLAAIPWNKVSKLIGNRTPLQCRVRYECSLASNVQHGRWTEAEDMFLLDAVNRYGPFDWFRIAENVPCRSATQCRARWACCLFVDRSMDPWNVEEDEILLTGVKIFGRGNWSAISTLLPRRLPSDIVNRFRSFVNSKIQGYIYCNRNVPISRNPRNNITLSRFQAMEEMTDPREQQQNALSNRFGMGNYVLGKDKEIRDVKNYLEEKKKQSRIYHLGSGRWRKLFTPEECRMANYERKVRDLSDEKREELDNFLAELEERRAEREERRLQFEEEEHDDEESFCPMTQEEIDAAVAKNNRLASEYVIATEADVEMYMRKKLPRVRIRKRKTKRRGRKPSDLVKVPKAKTEDQLREQCAIIRDMQITPEIAKLFNMPEGMTIRADGTTRRIDEIVLNEDHDGNLHWVTQREDFVLGILLALNQFTLRCSMYNYDQKWRHNGAKRSVEYFLRQLTLSSVPAVFPYNPVEPPPLENFEHLLNNLMLPCRGTLVATHEYRKRGKSIVSGLAHYFYDPLDHEGTHEVLEGATFTQIAEKRLDVSLPNRITDSIDYLVLRARMYKMFFLPMLMDYGQRSAASREKLADDLERHRNRRRKEALFVATGEIDEGELTIFGDDNTRVVREGVLTDVVRRIHHQNSQINEAIETIIHSSPIKMEASSITELDSPGLESEGSSTFVGPSTAAPVAPVEPPPSPPKKRTRRRKPKPTPVPPPRENSVILDDSEEPGPSASKRPRLNESNEVIVDLEGYSTLGTYKPRWVQQSLKKRKASAANPEELTLADLLFVRGRNRRVPTGTYDNAHKEGILDKVRPVIEQPGASTSASMAGPSTQT